MIFESDAVSIFFFEMSLKRLFLMVKKYKKENSCVHFRPPNRLLLTEQNDGRTARYTGHRCCAEEITFGQEPSSPYHSQS